MQLWWMKLTRFIIHNTANPFLPELLHAGASTAQPFRWAKTPSLYGWTPSVWPISDDQSSQCSGVDKFNWNKQKNLSFLLIQESDYVGFFTAENKKKDWTSIIFSNPVVMLCKILTVKYRIDNVGVSRTKSILFQLLKYWIQPAMKVSNCPCPYLTYEATKEDELSD